MSFNENEFLRWLAEQDSYYIEENAVKETWPSFYENYDLTGVTVQINPDTGKKEVPKRDYRHAVQYGTPLD